MAEPTSFPDQRPDPISVLEPESGTAGAKADLERLASVRARATGNNRPYLERPSAPVPSPPDTGKVPAAPPGISSVVLTPADLSELPSAQPQPEPAQVNLDVGRLAFLDRLANDPRVSPTTREWARILAYEILTTD